MWAYFELLGRAFLPTLTLFNLLLRLPVLSNLLPPIMFILLSFLPILQNLNPLILIHGFLYQYWGEGVILFTRHWVTFVSIAAYAAYGVTGSDTILVCL